MAKGEISSYDAAHARFQRASQESSYEHTGSEGLDVYTKGIVLPEGTLFINYQCNTINGDVNIVAYSDAGSHTFTGLAYDMQLGLRDMNLQLGGDNPKFTLPQTEEMLKIRVGIADKNPWDVYKTAKTNKDGRWKKRSDEEIGTIFDFEDPDMGVIMSVAHKDTREQDLVLISRIEAFGNFTVGWDRDNRLYSVIGIFEVHDTNKETVGDLLGLLPDEVISEIGLF